MWVFSGSGILICVGVDFGSVGGSGMVGLWVGVGGGGMVGVGLKAHLLRLATLNFEAIPCTKTHFDAGSVEFGFGFGF